MVRIPNFQYLFDMLHQLLTSHMYISTWTTKKFLKDYPSSDDYFVLAMGLLQTQDLQFYPIITTAPELRDCFLCIGM